ncbi:MAG: cold shock domain-containing protein, partial [Hymenobacter sp.]
EIALESIQIGVPKQEDREPEDVVRTGTVSFFNDSKGYGFIKDGTSQESIFVHANNLGGLTLREGNKVTFEVEPGMKGPTAVRVKMAA